VKTKRTRITIETRRVTVAREPITPHGREERLRLYASGIRSGNPDALGALYDETSTLLFNFALRILKCKADTEEVVLDVYQQVWKRAGTFDPSRGSVLGWLIVLTRSRAIDRLRRSRHLRRESCLETQMEPASKVYQPDTEGIRRDEREQVDRALATLVPEQREAIELAYFRDLTHVEIAQELGVPLGTIKTRIRAGIRKLRATCRALAGG
jgi:RNA polymerase sigma-70 factor (ECF subfamily)